MEVFDEGKEGKSKGMGSALWKAGFGMKRTMKMKEEDGDDGHKRVLGWRRMQKAGFGMKRTMKLKEEDGERRNFEKIL